MIRKIFIKKRRLLLVVIVVQVIIIGWLAFGIFRENQFVLGEATIESIDRNDIKSSPSAGLQYFYEPEANKTIKDNSVGESATYTINSDTLNESNEYVPVTKEGVYRIVTLGDSITYGLHVNTTQNWTELLEDKLNSVNCDGISKFEVINLAVQGYDNAYSLERYRRRGEKYAPDMVISYQYDLYRITEEQLKASSQYLPKFNPQNPSYEGSDIRAQLEHDLLQQAARNLVKRYGEEYILAYQKKALIDLRKLFSGKLVVVTFPGMKREHVDFLKKVFVEDRNSYTFSSSRDYVKENGSVDGVHPNPLGHTMISDDVFEYLNSQNVISCRR